MATTQDYIDYVIDQIDGVWEARYKKMFGEYMIYINDKPILLVCENTVYVKMLECISTIIDQDSKGFPYKGSKEHYIVDIENKELLNSVINELEKVISIPVKRKKKC